MANPSLAMIPSGYKAGKLYSVLPQDGAGDFTVSRNSVATRVNENGIIEEVAANVPRLDYSDGGCPVLLTEPQSTNLLLRSQEFDNASWVKTLATVTSNVILSPDNTLTADDLDAGGNSFCQLTQVVTLNGASTYTFSVFIKNNGNTKKFFLNAYGDNASTNSYIVNFNASDFTEFSALTQGDFTNTSNKIEEYGDNWYRVSITYTTNSSTTVSHRIGLSDTPDGTMRIWQADFIEYNTTLTPIKTEATTVTRVADVVTDAGDVNTFNSEEGVLFVEMAALAENTTERIISISDGTNGNRAGVEYRSYSNTITGRYVLNNASQAILSYSLPSQLNYIKVAFVYGINHFQLWVNSVKVLEDLIGNVATIDTFNTLNLNLGDGTDIFYGKIKQLKVFKTALTDQELQDLTTL